MKTYIKRLGTVELTVYHESLRSKLSQEVTMGGLSLSHFNMRDNIYTLCDNVIVDIHRELIKL